MLFNYLHFGELFLYSALIFAIIGYKAQVGSNFNLRPTLISLILAFASLTYAFIITDLNLKIVALNSSELTPLLYKITGIWGNHEGSMLLFLLFLSATSYIANLKESKSLFLIQIFLILYLLGVSNPFEIYTNATYGADLNPLLQDIGIAFHPPILYLGYVSLCIVYAYAYAFIKGDETYDNFIQKAKLWNKLALIFLTTGIAIGSWWAYRELGWGGFWFWDPVENSSLMPWLVSLALVHQFFLHKDQSKQSGIIFLSLISFCLALLGFFLVRSGMLSSVHSFAESPNRGLFMLGIFFLITYRALKQYLKFIKSNKPIKSEKKNNIFKISLETHRIITLLLLFVIILGILFPVISELIFGYKKSVGGYYYRLFFIPSVVILIPLSIYYIFKGREGAKLAHAGFALLVLSSAIHFLKADVYELKLASSETAQTPYGEFKLNSVSTNANNNYLARKADIELDGINYSPENRLYLTTRTQTTESSINSKLFNDTYIVMGEYSTDTKQAAFRIYHEPMIIYIWLSAILMVAGTLISFCKD